jgi:bacterioferritin (cytochrome b1)
MTDNKTQVAKADLLAGLNEDLAHEYAAVILYRTYASAVTGPFRQELRAFFANEIPDELGHAQLLADKIVALGGAPTVQAADVKSTTIRNRCCRTRSRTRLRQSLATSNAVAKPRQLVSQASPSTLTT